MFISRPKILLVHHGAGRQAFWQTGQKGQAAKMDPGAPEGQHAQPVHQEGGADQQKMAEANGATFYKRGPAWSLTFDGRTTAEKRNARKDTAECSTRLSLE